MNIIKRTAKNVILLIAFELSKLFANLPHKSFMQNTLRPYRKNVISHTPLLNNTTPNNTVKKCALWYVWALKIKTNEATIEAIIGIRT